MVALVEQSCGRKAQLELLPIQPGDVSETFADISAIQTELGFAPRTPISEGVPRFVQWYKDWQAGRAENLAPPRDASEQL